MSDCLVVREAKLYTVYLKTPLLMVVVLYTYRYTSVHTQFTFQLPWTRRATALIYILRCCSPSTGLQL